VDKVVSPSRPWEEYWEKRTPKDFMRVKWQFTHPAREKVYEIAERFGGSVLDVGCGTGIDYLKFTSRGMKYVGVDITSKFVARFKELHPEADVRCHSSLELPFADNSFSVVYAGGMIQHMHPDDYPKAIREMWRICVNTLILTTGKPFTTKMNIIQKVKGEVVYDNHYGMPLFLDIVRSLPHFKDVRFHANFKRTAPHRESYTVVEIMKEAK